MKDSMKFASGMIMFTVLFILGLVLLLTEKIGTGIYLIFVIASIAALLVPILFSKRRAISIDQESIRISAPFIDMEIPLKSIDSIHTFDVFKPYLRSWGYKGLHCSSGLFEYKTYGGVGCAFDNRVPLYIMIVSGKRKTVINMRTLEETKDLLMRLTTLSGKEVTEDIASGTEECKKKSKRRLIIVCSISAVAAIALVVGIVLSMTMGSVNVTLTDSDVEIDASLKSEISIPYSDITYIELRTDIDYGHRVIGTSTSKVLIGDFDNDEFGRYTLAVYKDTSKAIVIHTAEEVYVTNLSDDGSTEELYQDLLTRI